ncbi:MAG: phage tail protein [Calditrichaeota bacterium]|nr:MAG: phage tail protein [Calditrichota bacterium]MBL1208135.1 phage tail protein [Calditrichota bacterium]NOG47973.1 phage tail protein [Calditrichota bacterium]
MAQEPFIGEIKMFGGNFAPRGYAFCDGQLLPISQYSALFSILGTTYGGDGRTTFGLPDLRGRAPIHEGNGPGLSDRRLGQKGGQENVVLNITQIPSHTHTAQLNADSTVATSDKPESGLLARNAGSTPQYGDTVNTALNSAAVKVSNTGGNGAHPNMQPFITINYIIALEGIYPSRP